MIFKQIIAFNDDYNILLKQALKIMSRNYICILKTRFSCFLRTTLNFRDFRDFFNIF